jgi:hypothetical protein
MTLQNILFNDIIYTNILSNLSNNARVSLSNTCPSTYNFMTSRGFLKTLYFKCGNLDEYMKSLELYDVHKYYLETIIVDNQTDILTYLPKYEEDKKVILRNCELCIDDDKFISRLENMKLDNCRIKNCRIGSIRKL